MKKLHKLTPTQRQILVKHLTSEDKSGLITSTCSIPLEIGDTLIENFVNYFPLSFGIVENMPYERSTHNLLLAVEESSIIAALNKASKYFRESGRIQSIHSKRIIYGQISYLTADLSAQAGNLASLNKLLSDNYNSIRRYLGVKFQSYFDRGGKLLSLKAIKEGEFTTIYPAIDPLEAMGANLVTQFAEQISHYLMNNFNFPKPLMCILSNSLDEPTTIVQAMLNISERNICADQAKRIVLASQYAEQVPMRASTHNKGVMNAIDPILLMTGNDWRANSAAIHSYASRSGSYKPITSWDYSSGQLLGEIRIPLQLGIVGGATKIHPYAQLALDFMQISSSEQLAKISAAAGLLQNFSALNALVGEGIIQGHMKLHLSNIVYELTSQIDISDQAKQKLYNSLSEKLKQDKKVSLSDGKEILQEII